MTFCYNGTLEFHFKDNMKFIVFQQYLDAFIRDKIYSIIITYLRIISLMLLLHPCDTIFHETATLLFLNKLNQTIEVHFL